MNEPYEEKQLGIPDFKTSSIFKRIHIEGNQGWQEFKNSGNCTGSGTFSDPYTIKDFIIDGKSIGDCILIENSNLFFKIENCTVCNSNPISGSGIKLVNVSNGHLTKNNISLNHFGMNLFKNNYNNSIEGNYLNDNEIGMFLNLSYVNTIFKNNVSLKAYSNLYRHGIDLYDCYNNTICKNNLINYTDAIYIIGGQENLIKNNTIIKGNSGIWLESTSYNIIGENNIQNQGSHGIYIRSGGNFNIVTFNNIRYCRNDGIYLVRNKNNTISYNLLNNNPNAIHFFGCYNTTVQGNKIYKGGIDFEWNYLNPLTPLEELTSHKIDISNIVNEKNLYYYINENNLNPSNFTKAGQVILINCNHSKVSNQNLTYVNYGIQLYYCHNITISNNNASCNTYIGISLRDSDNNKISKNIANYNGYFGVSLRHKCFNNTILGNVLSNNEKGIYFLNAYNCNIIENTIQNNNNGIQFWDGDNDQNLIYNNTLINNGASVTIYYGDNNKIYYNKFYQADKNVFDGGQNNKWDNGIIGNYWSNYNGKDVDDNGIGDDPYLIYNNAKDNYPIWWDPPVISIISPVENSVFEDNPPSFKISIEEGINDTTWYTLDNGLTNITFNDSIGTVDQFYWDLLSEGFIIIIFYANDTKGYEGHDSVIIIKDTTAPTWDQLPTNQTVEYGNSFNYDINASDLSGISYYWINDTIHFTIDGNGVIINATILTVDVYWLEIRAYDPYGHYCMATIRNTVEDTTPPVWLQVPTVQTTEYGTSFSYNVNASDLSGISYYWINDTIHFTIDGNGVIINATILTVGIYWLEIRAYDPYGYSCITSFKIIIEYHDKPPDTSGSGSKIPGYNLIFFLSIVSIAIFIIIKKLNINSI